MKNFILRHRILTGIAGLFILSIVFALLALNWMFEEDNALHINSVAHHTKASSIFGIFAHPDDEQLVTGLFIKASQDKAIRSAAITATKGEAGTPLPQISRPEDLGWIRKAEALKNTWALGIEHHEVLDFPDGGLKDIALEELTTILHRQMIRHKPDLVVTFWPESGFSGHEDHKTMGLAAELTIKAFQQNPVDGYSGPSHIAYMLAPTRMMGRFAGNIGREVIANQPTANFSQSGEGWAKIRGWKIHASQQDFVWHTYHLPPWLLYRVYDKEHYYLIETKDIPER